MARTTRHPRPWMQPQVGGKYCGIPEELLVRDNDKYLNERMIDPWWGDPICGSKKKKAAKRDSARANRRRPITED